MKNKIKIAIILTGALILGVNSGFIYFAYKAQRLARQLEDAQKRLQEMAPGYEQLSKEGEDVKKKYTDLLREMETVKADRDNILADRNNILTQAKSLLGEKSRAAEIQASLENAVREIERVDQEKEKVRGQNQKLQEAVRQLMSAQERITQERDQFKTAANKLAQNKQIEELKARIVKLEKERDKSGFKKSWLKQFQRETKQLTDKKISLETEVKNLTGQIEEYKKRYAAAFEKNKALSRELRNVPAKFAEIARQNKRLIRQTGEMHYNLGVFYTKNKEYGRAVAEFDKVVEITPDDSYAHFNLGYIYAEYLVNRKKAIEHFRHFLRLAKSGDKDVDWVRKYLLTWETYEGKTVMQ